MNKDWIRKLFEQKEAKKKAQEKEKKKATKKQKVEREANLWSTNQQYQEAGDICQGSYFTPLGGVCGGVQEDGI
jgi:hypothetical protein